MIDGYWQDCGISNVLEMGIAQSGTRLVKWCVCVFGVCMCVQIMCMCGKMMAWCKTGISCVLALEIPQSYTNMMCVCFCMVECVHIRRNNKYIWQNIKKVALQLWIFLKTSYQKQENKEWNICEVISNRIYLLKIACFDSTHQVWGHLS